jgi:dipeptidyl aminopeptidase/acylaminoacyl peptidase
MAQFLKTRGVADAVFSPDGEHVAYLDDVTGTAQVWVTAVDCGRPTQVTFFDGRVRGVSWSWADPRRLLIQKDVDGDERYQLYLLDLEDADGRGGVRIERLTTAEGARHGFGGWSRDGHRIAYRSNARQPASFDAYVMDLGSRVARRVQESDGLLAAAGFAPGGERLLTKLTTGPDESRLFVVDLRDDAVRPLTPADAPAARYDYTYWTADGRGILTLTDRDRDLRSLARIDVASGAVEYLRDDPWPAERLEVSADGRRLALSLNEDGYSELHLHDLEADRALDVPALPRGVIYDLDFTPDGRRLAVTLRTPQRMGEIFVIDLETGTVRQLTHASQAGIPDSILVEPRIVRYQSFDGLEIPALLFVPDRPSGRRPPPCLVYAHGGPTSQSRPRFSGFLQYFAARGFVVFAPNVRGSSGYGRTFLNLDNVERREDSVRDLALGVEWLVAEGLVDPERVAIYGGSYGGYMVLAALTLYPDMWAAGVESAGIANFVTFLEGTGAYRRAHREQEYGSLATDRELLRRLSPIHRADSIQAPLLILHGANDPRVPVGEAEQIAAALEARGGVVEFMRHEDEGHSIGRVERRIETYTRVAAFIEEHLGLAPSP